MTRLAARRVLAHRVAITMQAEQAMAALEEAFARYKIPNIVNTGQGSQRNCNQSFSRSIGLPCEAHSTKTCP
jgi:transposase InsO family protein